MMKSVDTMSTFLDQYHLQDGLIALTEQTKDTQKIDDTELFKPYHLQRQIYNF